MERRRFLKLAGGSAGLSFLVPRVEAKTDIVEVRTKIEIRVWSAEGVPFAKTKLSRLYFLDLQDEPLPNPSRWIEDGTLWSVPPVIPFAIALNLPVLGFGEVTLYADNQGTGLLRVDRVKASHH